MTYFTAVLYDLHVYKVYYITYLMVKWPINMT